MTAAEGIEAAGLARDVAGVAIIVAGTLLSGACTITLEVELEGRRPWQRERKQPGPRAAE